MIYKPCVEIYIDNSLKYHKLINEFQEATESVFVFINDLKNADIIISNTILKETAINVVITEDKNPLNFKENVFPFQPFLNGKQGNIDTLGKELAEFVKNICYQLNLPVKNDNTILILC